MEKNEDLVTGTPVAFNPADFPVWYNKHLEIFKVIQRIIMVVLTVGVLIVMCHVGDEIVVMQKELKQSRITIEAMKDKIADLTKEINKGIKIRLW
jgi:cell division protein FtsL